MRAAALTEHHGDGDGEGDEEVGQQVGVQLISRLEGQRVVHRDEVLRRARSEEMSADTGERRYTHAYMDTRTHAHAQSQRVRWYSRAATHTCIHRHKFSFEQGVARIPCSRDAHTHAHLPHTHALT